jgi:hypothetical protein
MFRGLALLLAGVIFLLVAEAAFRIFLPVSDIPYWQSDAGVGYRHHPGLQGRFVSGAYNVRFRVNNRGWNSLKDYSERREEGVGRVAIVGDSYVEALQVDVGEAFGEVLERLLRQEGKPVEVYRYGISGASTAYAHDLLPLEVLRDRPDCVIYLFIDNDLEDSVPFLGSPQRWGPRYDLDPGGALRRLPLSTYEPRLLSRTLSHLALFRYFWINRGLGTFGQTGGGWGRIQDAKLAEEEGLEWERGWQVIGGLVGEMAAASRAAGADFLVVNRPDSANFYPSGFSGQLNLDEKQLAELAAARDFSFVDLRPWFSRDWEARHEPFEFTDDKHWNRHGHEVAARALKDLLLERCPSISGSPGASDTP